MGFSFAVFVISENFLTLTYENKSISHFEFFRGSVLQNSVRTVGRIIYFMLFYVISHLLILQDFRFQCVLPCIFHSSPSRFLAKLNLSVLIELYAIGLFIFTTWCSALLIVQSSLTLNLPPIESDDSHLIAVGDFLASSNSDGLVYVSFQCCSFTV